LAFAKGKSGWAKTVFVLYAKSISEGAGAPKRADLSVSYPIFSKIAYSVNNFLSIFNIRKKL